MAGVLVGLMAAAQALPAAAAESDRSAPAEFGIGLGCVAGTALWGPAKLLFAVGGTITGGLGWVFTGGDTEVARRIIQPAIRGDYVIVPGHITGERPPVFWGRDPQDAYPY